MPYFHHQFLPPDAQLGLWRIEETESYFRQQLVLQPAEDAELERIKGRRRIEWLASRYLVHRMLLDLGQEDRVPVLKDEFGKPHLWGTEFHLSFSHSYDLVAVMLAKHPTGIDVQKFVPRIEAIGHKFMREVEMKSLNSEFRLEHLHLYWGAKEALYKAYGRRELDFRQHILVEPFVFEIPGTTPAKIIKDGFDATYHLFFDRIDNYYLVYCIEAQTH